MSCFSIVGIGDPSVICSWQTSVDTKKSSETEVSASSHYQSIRRKTLEKWLKSTSSLFRSFTGWMCGKKPTRSVLTLIVRTVTFNPPISSCKIEKWSMQPIPVDPWGDFRHNMYRGLSVTIANRKKRNRRSSISLGSLGFVVSVVGL